MRSKLELRAFQTLAGLVLLIPGIVGPVGAFLGLPTLARVLQAEQPTIPASLHNSLRAICWMFFSLVPLVIWSLRAMKERAGAFQIIITCAFIAGFARLTGYLVNGWPGPVPVVFMAMELALMPVILLWHRRLLRSA